VRVPAALVTLPLVIGCGGGLLFADCAPTHFVLCAAAAGVLALLGAVTSLALGDDASAECSVAVVVGTLVAGLSLGAGAAARAYHSSLLTWFAARGPQPSSPIVLRGVLREDAAPLQTGVSLVIDVDRVGLCREPARVEPVRAEPDRAESCAFAVRGGVRLSVAGTLAATSMGEWRAGRAVRITATLREPVSYRTPGVPDERRALARRGIVLVGSVKSAALVEITASGSRANEWASAFRAWSRSALGATVGFWSDRSAGVAAAIAIGDRTGLAQEDARRLQEAGTYHVIAISGGNIAILTILLLGVMRRMRVPPRVAACAAILVLIFYGRVTGPAPSVDRAIAAAILYLSGRLLDHRGPPVNILAVTAILGLAVSPTAAFDPGFILSFGATLGILVVVPRVVLWVQGDRAGAVVRLVAGAVGLLAATVAAEIALAPVSAALFARVTFAGLVLNFVAIPLMTVVQAGSMAALCAWLFHPEIARGCGYAVHVSARWLIDSARLVDVAPWLSREVAPPAWWLLAAYYVALIVSLSRPRVASGAALVAAALGVVIVIGPHSTSRDGVDRPVVGALRMAFLDVGQGDATLVVLPDKRALLVDAGGLPAAPLQDPDESPAFDIGARVVSRGLRAFGVRSLDTFVLTHADPDHIGGARSVLRSFRPHAIWEGVPVPAHVPLQSLARTADLLGTEWRTVLAGDRLRIAGVDIRALHPPPPDWERQRVRNDDSIVLAVRFGQVLVILPGDVGREGEARALQHLEPAPIVVLKAPHHGSATSSTAEFLAAAHPAVVIFSAGRANRFGHPARAVVERYRALGVTMFSTADDGAVILDTDGRTVQIRGWTGRKIQITGRADGSARRPR